MPLGDLYRPPWPCVHIESKEGNIAIIDARLIIMHSNPKQFIADECNNISPDHWDYANMKFTLVEN